MKVYVCDACDSRITDPYDVGMKEFKIVTDFDDGSPWMFTHRTKIHLCHTCFKNLKNLANKKEGFLPGGRAD